jgi:4-amino-4-deoxy-L-arabinose transferase-like glycosyltransferase
MDIRLQKIFKRIRENKKFFALFFTVLAAGIFLRTWHFHDWLRFSEDEARDATIIDNIINHHESLPLLGPVASVSEFKLGPAYYYIQFAAAKIFGDFPVKLAYPDLIFSLLSIPLLYLLLRKYFRSDVSLAVTAVFSFSFFIIKYSRFAWNPNSTPFFSILFLYSFLQLADPKVKNKILWAALAGIGIGIGVQLHAVFLLVFPIVFLVAGAFALRKKIINWKNIVLIALVALVLNTPQIIFELKFRGENTRAFIAEVFKRDEKGGSFLGKTIPSFTCQMQANSMILTYFADDNRCNYFLKKSENIQNYPVDSSFSERNYFYLELFLSFAFTIGGYFLFVYFLRREKDPEKKNFLKLFFLLALVAPAVLTPMIEGVYTRFLIPLAVIPFVFLGLWLKMILEKTKKRSILLLSSIIILFVAANLSHIRKAYSAFSALGQTSENRSESATLGEEQFLSEFILRDSQNSQTAYLQGGYEDIFKFIEPARYFFQSRPDLDVRIWAGEKKVDPDASYFRIDMIEQVERRVQMSQQTIKDRNVLDKGYFGRYAIFKLDGPVEQKVNKTLLKQVGK